MAINIERISGKAGKPAILLREAWREGKRIRKKTIANLSKLKPEHIEGLRAVMKGAVAVTNVNDLLNVERSLPHGHIAATLGTLRSLGLVRVLGRKSERMRQLAVAAIVARVVDPASKLATARTLSPETASSSLGLLLDLGAVTGNEMLDMLDWLHKRQRWIEKSLANRYLKGENTLILYDVSSSDLEGRCCPLAAFGYNRDGKKGKRQIVYGLLCAGNGCPVAVEVFAGNMADPLTLSSQVQKVRSRFGVERVALVGDRGMLTTARIREDIDPAGLDWISALRTTDIRRLLKEGADGAAAALDPETLVADRVAEITEPDFPGERLMVCLNPRLQSERRRKREALLQSTEEILASIAAAAGRRRPGPANREQTAKALGRMANQRKVEKHFDIVIRDDGMDWARSSERIKAEARLDGIYVVRTSRGTGTIGLEAVVEAYKSLSCVERAFRNVKSDLRIRPVHIYTANRVRAHLFLCMLALHIEWHMRRRLAPMLFEDDDREAGRSQRNSPVEPASVSDGAKSKAATKWTPDGLPVHSFQTLVADLSTVVLNRVRLPGQDHSLLSVITTPTPVQKRAFCLLDVKPDQNVPIKMPG